MLELRQWEIYEAYVPFREFQNRSKKRPVLIISPSEVLVLKMTSHGGRDNPRPLEYELSKWKEAGLEKKTFVECDHFVELRKDQFTGKYYGRLQFVDIIGIREMMRFHGLTLR